MSSRLHWVLELPRPRSKAARTKFAPGSEFLTLPLLIETVQGRKLLMQALELLYFPATDLYQADIGVLENIFESLDLEPSDLSSFTFLQDGEELSLLEVFVEDGWAEQPGTFLPYAEFAGFEDEAAEPEPLPPPPPLETVKALKQREVTWEVTSGPFGVVNTPRGPGVVYVALALEGPSMQLLSPELQTELAFDGEALLGTVLRRCAELGYRPESVRLDTDSGSLFDLMPRLSSLGIALESVTPNAARAALADLQQSSWADASPPMRLEPDLRNAFVAAMVRFWDAQPWTKFAARKLVAFRLEPHVGGPHVGGPQGDSPQAQEGGVWRYANVMGQNGEQFGLALFGDWIKACLFFNNVTRGWLAAFEDQSIPDSVRAVGGAETASWGPPELVHPLDLDWLNRAAAVREGLYPSHSRFAVDESEDGETGFGEVTPHLSSREVMAALEAVSQRASSGRGQTISKFKTTFATELGRLEVVYPATGTEQADGRAFRLELSFEVAYGPSSGQWHHLTCQAPGNTPLEALFKEIVRVEREHDKDFYASFTLSLSDPSLSDPTLERKNDDEDPFGAAWSDYRFYDHRASDKGLSPTLGQTFDTPHLAWRFNYNPTQASLTVLEGGVDALSVTLELGKRVGKRKQGQDR